MARKPIKNTPENSRQGDTIKEAFDKVNLNEQELYQRTSDLENNKANDSEVLKNNKGSDTLYKGDGTVKPISDFATSLQGQKADGAVQVETDPTVPQYVKNIIPSDINKWNNKLDSETDPTVPNFVKEIKELDIDNWNNKLDSETDPTVPQHVKDILESDITKWNNMLDDETDPTVPSFVKSITQLDIDRWDSALQDETDPTVPQHVKNILTTDIQKWNNGIETETDPTVPQHVKNIAQSDINEWNDKLDSSALNGLATEQWVNSQGFVKTDDDTLYTAGEGLDLTDLKFSLTQDVQDSLNKADTALQSFTEEDPTVPSHVKDITQEDIDRWDSNQGGGIETETDPTVPQHVKDILTSDITSWNDKLESSDLNGLATEQWVENKGYVTTDTDTTYTAGEGLDLTGAKFSLTQEVQDSLNKADTALQSFTEEDPTVPSHVKNILSSDITSWNNKLESSALNGLASESWVNSQGFVKTDTDTTYTAGEGLDLNGSEFKLSTDTINSLNKADSSLQGLQFTPDASTKTIEIKDSEGNSITTLDLSDFNFGSGVSSVVMKFEVSSNTNNDASLLLEGKSSTNNDVSDYGIDIGRGDNFKMINNGKFFIAIFNDSLKVYFPPSPSNINGDVLEFETKEFLDDLTRVLLGKITYLGTEKIFEIDSTYISNNTSGDVSCDFLTSDYNGTDFYQEWQGGIFKSYFPKINFPNGTNFESTWYNNNLKSFPKIDMPNGTNFRSAWSLNSLKSFPKIDMSNGTNFSSAWSQNSLKSFPAIDMPNGTDFERTWADNSLTSFPLIDLSSGTNFFSAWSSNNLESFPLIDLSNGTDFDHAWSSNNLESFPLIDLSSGTNFFSAWSSNNLESFPLIDLSSGTNFHSAWSYNNLTEFPLIDLSSGTNFRSAWRYNNLTSFPAIDMPNGTNFEYTWDGCDLENFPLIDLSSGTNFESTWRNNNLTEFPPNMFDNCQCTDFEYAWRGNNLDQQSVDNILVSISTAADTFNLLNGIVGIQDGTNATPSSTGKAAADNLRSKRWTVSLNGY